MYKTLKYFHESGKIFFNIAGLIILSIITLMACNFVMDEYITKPVTKQAIVITKYTKDNFSLSNSLGDNKTYNIIIKDEANKLYNLTTTEREFKYINENEHYVMQIKNDKLLYVINTVQKQFLVLNKMQMATIDITNDDLEKAMAFVGDGNIKPVVKEEPEDIANDEPTETPIEETPPIETPVDTGEPAETETVVETPIDEAPIEEEPTEVEPVVQEPTIEVPSVEQPPTNENTPQEAFLTARYFSITEDNNKAVVDSLSSSKYITTIVVNDKEISCSDVKEDIGKCIKIKKKTVWTLSGLPVGTSFQIKVYSDDIEYDTDINFQ